MSRINKAEDDPKRQYSYFYCRRCQMYFTVDSYLPGSVCPHCSMPGGAYYSLIMVFLDEPVRDRLFIAIPQCATCTGTGAAFCPDCFGADKRQADHCRTCSCAKCCSETIEFANNIRNGMVSIYQAIKEAAEERDMEPRKDVATPKPMAKTIDKLPAWSHEEVPF
jgi:hypothetical protein